MADYTVLDLLKFSNESKPQDFKTAFNDVVRDKISAAIDVRKEIVADQMFNGASEEDVDDVEELDVDDEGDEEPEINEE